mgnify:CR=1 FL=1|jgi:hypothetical protein
MSWIPGVVLNSVFSTSKKWANSAFSPKKELLINSKPEFLFYYYVNFLLFYIIAGARNKCS